MSVSDDEDCELCDGTGEVMIYPRGDMRKGDYFGCPMCMSREFAEERASLKEKIAKLECAPCG